MNGVEMVYEGEWDYDQKNGKGTMTYWDKSTYVGMWKDDKVRNNNDINIKSIIIVMIAN